MKELLFFVVLRTQRRGFDERLHSAQGYLLVRVDEGRGVILLVAVKAGADGLECLIGSE